jgi:hypothetical protein
MNGALQMSGDSQNLIRRFPRMTVYHTKSVRGRDCEAPNIARRPCAVLVGHGNLCEIEKEGYNTIILSFRVICTKTPNSRTFSEAIRVISIDDHQISRTLHPIELKRVLNNWASYGLKHVHISRFWIAPGGWL